MLMLVRTAYTRLASSSSGEAKKAHARRKDAKPPLELCRACRSRRRRKRLEFVARPRNEFFHPKSLARKAYAKCVARRARTHTPRNEFLPWSANVLQNPWVFCGF